MSRREPSLRLSMLALLCGACSCWAAGCGGNDPKTSSESNWLLCDTDQDCAQLTDATCSEEGICVDATGEPIEVDSPDPITPNPSPSDDPNDVSATAGDGSAEVAPDPDAGNNPGSSEGSKDAGAMDSGTQLDSSSTEESGECGSGPFEEWVMIDGPDVSWPAPGTQLFAPAGVPTLRSGVVGNSLYVIHIEMARAFEFDACSATWSELEVPSDFDINFTLAWRNGRFLVSRTSETELLTFDPASGVSELRPASEYEPPPLTVDWPDSPSEALRYAPSATSGPYTLYFGGVIRSLVPEREAGSPDVWVLGDGQVLDNRTTELRTVSEVGAPSARLLAQVFPMDERFMVWGGFAESDDTLAVPESVLSDGALYDPALDEWLPVSSVGAPAQPTEGQTNTSLTQAMNSAWTGERLVVFAPGGPRTYDPESDSWSTTDASGTFRGNGAVVGPRYYVEMGSTESTRLDVSSSTVRILQLGDTPPALSEELAELTAHGSVQWAIDAWVGSTRLRWGPWASWGEGCENPPPNTGCDPLLVTQVAEGGGMVRFSN